jgi:hypothetical protein
MFGLFFDIYLFFICTIFFLLQESWLNLCSVLISECTGMLPCYITHGVDGGRVVSDGSKARAMLTKHGLRLQIFPQADVIVLFLSFNLLMQNDRMVCHHFSRLTSPARIV